MAVKKKLSAYRLIYFSTLAVLFAALLIWLFFLRGWLADFEAAQPKYVAEETFREYFGDFNAAEFLKVCSKADTFESETSLAEYLNNAVDGKKLSYKKVSSGMEDTYKYVVFVDGEKKIASFTLAVDKDSGGRFKTYEACDFAVFTESNKTYTVEVPKGYTVLVNDKTIPEDYITEDDIATESCEYMPEGVKGIYNTRYTLKGLLAKPEVKVQSPDGVDVKVTEKDNAFVSGPVFDVDLAKEYTDWIIEGVEKYAQYSQYDWKVSATGFNQVAPFFDPTSELYESIRTVENMFVIEYDKFEFDEMEASEFVRYDENTFSCRVQYTQKLYKGSEVYDDFVDQILYLRKVDGEYRIYEMKVN